MMHVTLPAARPETVPPFSFARRRLLMLITSSLLFGCQPSCETEGLSELFDASPTFVRFPGKQLAEGRYGGLWLDGSVTERGHILARDLDDGALTIVPFDGSEACKVGPAARYWSYLQAFGLQEAQGYVPFIESIDASHRGTLGLATFDCQLSSIRLENSGAPVRPAPAVTPLAYLAMQGGTTLHRLDPWNDEQSVVAEQVGQLSFDGEHLWTLEAGEVVVRDPSLEEFRRYGKGTTELLVWTAGVVYFTDEAGLHKVDLGEDTEQLIVEGACRMASPRGGSSAYVATLAPCAESRLVVVDTATDEATVLAETAALGVHVSELRHSGENRRYLSYITDIDEATGLGKLWTKTLEDDDPVLIGSGTSLRSVKSPFTNRLPVIVDADDGPGRLILWSPDGTDEIAEGVDDIALPLILEQHDGKTGTLSVLTEGDERQELATGIPSLGTSIPGRHAMLSDYDGKVGTLILVTPLKDGGFDVEPLASGVPAPGYLFLRFADAISYLKDVEPGSGFGRLEIRFFSTNETYGVDSVSEWMAMDWPDVGVVYSVPDGDRSGIWFGSFQ